MHCCSAARWSGFSAFACTDLGHRRQCGPDQYFAYSVEHLEPSKAKFTRFQIAKPLYLSILGPQVRLDQLYGERVV